MPHGMLPPKDGEADMDDDFDVARLVMRVRRMADLQPAGPGGAARHVALDGGPHRDRRVLGVGRPPLPHPRLRRAATRGGRRRRRRGATGRERHPARQRGSPLPSHLDVDLPDQVPMLRQLMPRRDRPPAKGWYRQREHRDELRAQDGAPPDHPTTP